MNEWMKPKSINKWTIKINDEWTRTTTTKPTKIAMKICANEKLKSWNYQIPKEPWEKSNSFHLLFSHCVLEYQIDASQSSNQRCKQVISEPNGGTHTHTQTVIEIAFSCSSHMNDVNGLLRMVETCSNVTNAPNERSNECKTLFKLKTNTKTFRDWLVLGGIHTHTHTRCHCYCHHIVPNVIHHFSLSCRLFFFSLHSRLFLAHTVIFKLRLKM